MRRESSRAGQTVRFFRRAQITFVFPLQFTSIFTRQKLKAISFKNVKYTSGKPVLPAVIWRHRDLRIPWFCFCFCSVTLLLRGGGGGEEERLQLDCSW